MNLQAQNALLKTLEEPGEASVLILVSSRPQLLLPTVRSRAFGIRFVTLRAAELAALLEARGIPRAEAKVRASLADGRAQPDLRRPCSIKSEILTRPGR